MVHGTISGVYSTECGTARILYLKNRSRQVIILHKKGPTCFSSIKKWLSWDNIKDRGPFRRQFNRMGNYQETIFENRPRQDTILNKRRLNRRLLYRKGSCQVTVSKKWVYNPPNPIWTCQVSFYGTGPVSKLYYRICIWQSLIL